MNTDLSDTPTPEAQIVIPAADQLDTVNWLRRKFPAAADNVIHATAFLIGVVTASSQQPMKPGQSVGPQPLGVSYDQYTLTLTVLMAQGKRKKGRMFEIEYGDTTVYVNDSHSFYLNCVRLVDFFTAIYR